MFLQKLTNWYFTKRALPYWCVLALDCLILVLSILAVYGIAHGAHNLAAHARGLAITIPVYLVFFGVFFRLFHTYQGVLRYSSFTDLWHLAAANFGAATLIFVCRWLFHIDRWLVTIRYREVLVAVLLATLLMWALRIIIKTLYDGSFSGRGTRRTFIYGVKQGGVSLAKSITTQKPPQYNLCGFVSDDPTTAHYYIMGRRVYANDDKLIYRMKKLNVNTLIVSPLKSEAFRNNSVMVDSLISAGIHILMMSPEKEWDGHSELTPSQFVNVNVESLLPRDKIEVDMQSIGALLYDKVILITGAAGSIGSEIVRQVAIYSPKQLILIDQAETPMHDLRLELAKRFPALQALTVVTSITNQGHMEELFRDNRPDYVFHAAAYKHVPMMEDNPCEAVQNNCYGTRVVADLAVKYGVKKFVMISTDKAVNPTNVMGCSKRICEIYVQSLSEKLRQEYYASLLEQGEGATVEAVSAVLDNPASTPEAIRSALNRLSALRPFPTQFITTRFGNVLGSNGSVIPLFRQQIAAGGPVTVTHPDIVRFFMLIPEACKLVLEAGTMGRGSEIFVFDMGQPVRIADLAKRMIKLSGAKNIEIEYTGLRDGEKLYEEVLSDAEETIPTHHPKIRIAKVRKYDYSDALRNEEELQAVAATFDDMATVRKMKEIVPEYKSQQSKYEVLDK